MAVPSGHGGFVGRPPRFPVLWFFALTFLLTVIGQAVNLYVMHRLSIGVPPGTPIAETPAFRWRPYGFYLTNAGPSLVGLLMTLRLGGVAGLRRTVRRLAPWSVGRAWPVLAVGLFLPLVIVVVPHAIAGVFGASGPLQPWSLPGYLYGAVVAGGLIGPGICEELGWRGFALPMLQRRYSALASSLVVGTAWALWHWPNYFVASIHSQPLWAFAASVPMGMAAAVIYTWVYNSTGGSLFAVVVLHGATVATPAPPPGPAAVVIPLLDAAVAVGLVWRYGAADLSWRPKVIAEPSAESAMPREGARS